MGLTVDILLCLFVSMFSVSEKLGAIYLIIHLIIIYLIICVYIYICIIHIYGIYKMRSELLIHISMKDKFTNKTIVVVYNLFCLEPIATSGNTVFRLFRSVFYPLQ